MVEPYFDRLSGLIKQDINMFTGGINTYQDKAFIADDQLAYSMNMGMYQPPMICTRPMRKTILAGGPNNNKASAMWGYNDSLAFFIEENDANAKILAVYYNVSIERWTLIDPECTINKSTYYYFCYCRDGQTEYLYVTTKSQKVKIPITPDHSPYIGTPQTITDGHYGMAAFHKGRLFFMDEETNVITYSALWDFDNFTPVPEGTDPLDVDYSSYAGDFLVTNSAGKITAIKSFDDKLVIFAEHSMHLLYGDTPLINSSSQFQLVDMNNNLGCMARNSIAAGGGNLFWMGDDMEVYSYTGSSIDMISRPNASRYVNRGGGISNIPFREGFTIGASLYSNIVATATSDKYYLNYPIDYDPPQEDEKPTANPLLVYDTYNKVWWAEDGAFSALCNISFGSNNILMARGNDILKTTHEYTGYDKYWTTEEGSLVIKDIPIEYEFHTKVYGVASVSGRKSISQVWLQASAEANVYLTDSWISTNYWASPHLNSTLKQIGTLTKRGRPVTDRGTDYLSVYEPELYEQQVCYVEKMYGQRLNAFQIVVRGTGTSKFYLMQRKWRTNENV